MFGIAKEMLTSTKTKSDIASLVILNAVRKTEHSSSIHLAFV
jgi:hypothetical protein